MWIPDAADGCQTTDLCTLSLTVMLDTRNLCSSMSRQRIGIPLGSCTQRHSLSFQSLVATGIIWKAGLSGHIIMIMPSHLQKRHGRNWNPMLGSGRETVYKTKLSWPKWFCLKMGTNVFLLICQLCRAKSPQSVHKSQLWSHFGKSDCGTVSGSNTYGAVPALLDIKICMFSVFAKAVVDDDVGLNVLMCRQSVVMMMMSWCLLSSDVIWHIRDKLWPMPKHGSINLYVHGNQKAR